MISEPSPLFRSEAHLITSQHNGRNYRITINVPLGYNSSPGDDWPFHNPPNLWPVVYVLDGNWYADMVTGIIRPMAWCGSTTDAIVVGIGYPETDDLVESFRTSFVRRNHDLTPIRDQAEEQSMAAQFNCPVPSGDAAGFHKFLTDELIPFIEREYRADPARRILAGHSYGGLFAIYSLFQTPEQFDTLIIGSPTLSYGSRHMFQREEAYAKEHTQLPANVYLYAAEGEEFLNDTTLTDTLRLAAILESRNYEGFRLTKRIFLGENHCEVAAPGLHAGLKFALKNQIG